MAWMVYGDLSDSSEEFFIQLQDRQRTQGGNKPGLGFDWSTSYSIRLALIPESHLSPRLASKVLFVGKAVKLLETSSESLSEFAFGTSASDRELYEYLSGRKLVGLSRKSRMPPLVSLQEGLGPSPTEFINAAVKTQFEKKGFSAEDTDRFVKRYELILTDASHATEHLEVLVNDISDTISSKLWGLLRDVYGFKQLCFALRNTYLLGKGEFFQTILDNILLHTETPAPGTQEINVLLRNNVLKAAAERHDLDDDSLRSLLQMHVNAPSLSISDFSGDNVALSGTSATLEDNETGGVYICTMPKVEISTAFEGLWSAILKRSDVQLPSVDSLSKPFYTKGALWLPDHKFIAKGFSASARLLIDWTSVFVTLSAKHAWIPLEKVAATANDSQARLKSSLLLGSLAWVIHCDKLGPRVIGEGELGIGIFRSIAVGVSFHASLQAGSINYFARVFVVSHGNDSRHDYLGNPVADAIIELGFGGESTPAAGKSVRASEPLILEVEYSREFHSSPNMIQTSSKSSLRASVGGAVSLMLKVRLKEMEVKSSNPLPWDIETALDIGSVVKLQGGHSFIGLTGSSIVLNPEASTFTVNVESTLSSPLKPKPTLISETQTQSPIFGIFGIKVSRIEFLGKGALTTYPVASTYTTTRHPDTYARLDAVVGQLRSWMTLKMRFKMPSIFLVLVDEESLTCYERLFSFAMKV